MGYRGPIFKEIEIDGEKRRVHMRCAEELVNSDEVIAPHIYPEGPNFREYKE
jgi:hypothetical protein